ncbi:hypothetical protein FRC19_004526 [Serendipita sp. 401]|nr:hypothetical protein FRC19_004526 [Serendipita sp. 401]KAG9054049.1 hypothetical protein FS842_006347 [Serendipita sp. 407]
MRFSAHASFLQLSTLFVGYLAGLASAAPAPVPAPALVERQLTVLSSAEIETFTPYTLFASAGYCTPNITLTWSCGSKYLYTPSVSMNILKTSALLAVCDKLAGFKPVASGGNGGSVQYWYVGYYPALSSIVVGYQGTKVDEIQALLTNANFGLTAPSQTLFPGLPSGAQAHSGFLNAYAGSQASVLAAVQSASSTYGTKKITLVGHSLGAALATISAASMKLRLGSSWTIKVVGYGQPRVGNQAWVTWVDANLPDLNRINNKDDPVPILPGRFLGYVGSDGEIHIRDDNAWVNCPGDDNTSAGCTVHDVGSILAANTDDHLGPYNGLRIRCNGV